MAGQVFCSLRNLFIRCVFYDATARKKGSKGSTGRIGGRQGKAQTHNNEEAFEGDIFMCLNGRHATPVRRQTHRTPATNSCCYKGVSHLGRPRTSPTIHSCTIPPSRFALLPKGLLRTSTPGVLSLRSPPTDGSTTPTSPSDFSATQNLCDVSSRPTVESPASRTTAIEPRFHARARMPTQMRILLLFVDTPTLGLNA